MHKSLQLINYIFFRLMFLKSLIRNVRKLPTRMPTLTTPHPTSVKSNFVICAGTSAKNTTSKVVRQKRSCWLVKIFKNSGAFLTPFVRRMIGMSRLYQLLFTRKSSNSSLKRCSLQSTKFSTQISPPNKWLLRSLSLYWKKICWSILSMPPSIAWSTSSTPNTSYKSWKK